ncbi:MAG: TetR/AcrR family transcriptional regulator C-terminal ligand-binding domain-containing protein [Solirubrobacterales bacterium]|nr:TetR/AcrR family transcriptional regulator C-terminal ligand-binding domain-containing protein [Solirubrobacterales bacterium]
MSDPDIPSPASLSDEDGAAAASPVSARLAPMPARNQAEPVDPVRARAGGRPLDENVDAAILDTAWRLLLEEGYARMSIARVAEEARVGRPAIYRRYRDKSELVAAVLADKQARTKPIDTGSARGDLIAHLEFARRRFAVELAGTMIVEGRKHPELLDGFRRGMLGPRMADIVGALERGKERGEIRPDLDTEVAVHALMGAFMYHRIAQGQPKKGWSEHVVDQLWPAFAA